MGQHFSIRRIGAFLRNVPQNTTEAAYEKFVSGQRDKFFKWGSRGFTVLTYFAAIALLWETKGGLSTLDWSWFGLLFLGFFLMVVHANRVLNDLDLLTKNKLGQIEKKEKAPES